MKVLVVAAHPDDEVLGCGGTVSRHVAAGDTVGLIVMTDGVSSRTLSAEQDALERDDALGRSCKNLGITFVKRLNFPDNGMDQLPLLEVVRPLEDVIKELGPDLIYTHYVNDLNVDHRCVHQAVMTACRPQPNHPVREIRTFEVVSSSHWNSGEEFSPNLFIDISKFSEQKRKSLKEYDQEMREWPHQRSYKAIEALENFRGATVGVEKAEAFVVVRKIEK